MSLDPACMKFCGLDLEEVQFEFDDEDAEQQTNGAGYGCSKRHGHDLQYLRGSGYPIRERNMGERRSGRILFARLDKCDAPYRPVQPLVSKDGGKTWGVTGPLLESSDLEYFLDTRSELFIAGEDIAEGSAHNPFLLVYRATDNAWQQSEIYDQASELLGVAHEAKTGRFLAWVRHLELEKNGDWSGPVFLHRSLDGGKTWRSSKR